MIDDQFDAAVVADDVQAEAKAFKCPFGVPYPSVTIDVIKILRAEGVKVDYVDPARSRVTVDVKAAEVWLPIIVFTSEALANGLGGVLTAAFLEMVGKARASKTRLHARVGRIRSGDVEIEWLDVDGQADAALEAIERFFGDRDD